MIFALLACLGGAQLAAAATLDGTFQTSGKPGRMVLGPDGNVWFALSDSSDDKELGRISPDGTITEYDTPDDKAIVDLAAGPSVLGGPDDRIWMSQNGQVLSWDPVSGTGTVVPVPALNGPRGVAADRDGYVWLVDDVDGLIRLDPDGTATEVPVAGSGGRGITLGGDGNLWWADFGSQSIERTAATDPFASTAFDVGGGPQEIAAGPDGQLGYSNPGDSPQTVGTITTAGQFAEVEVPGTDPFGVTFASDRAYWFANFASHDLGRLATDGSHTTPVEMPDGSGPRYLTAGQPGTIWVGLEITGQIARVTGVPVPQDNPPGGGALTMKKVKVKLKKRRPVLSLRLNRPAKVRAVLKKKRRNGRFGKVRTFRRGGKAGANTFRLGAPLRRGTYRLVVTATAGGKKAGPVTRTFRR